MLDYLIGILIASVGFALIKMRRKRPFYKENEKGQDSFEKLWYELEDYFAGIGLVLLGIFIAYFKIATLLWNK